MEPRIRYAITPDEVRIAFLSSGQGAPLVSMPAIPFSHIQLEWEQAGWRNWHGRLGADRRLVRYDGRGTGLSERNVAEYSLAAHLLDLEAVVDRLGLDRFALFAPQHAGPVAIAYAARYPQRVSRLVLWCSYARAADYRDSSPVQAIRAALEKDWMVFTEAGAYMVVGPGAPEAAQDLATYMRAAVTQDAAREILDSTAEFDVADLLSDVKTPTLVVHREHVLFPDVAIARELASSMANARLAVVTGSSILPFVGDMDTPATAIEEFLQEELAAGLPDGLTMREAEILRLLVAGKSSREIGEELVLSARTVERHIANIYRKTNAHGRAQATAYALARGLLQGDAG